MQIFYRCHVVIPGMAHEITGRKSVVIGENQNQKNLKKGSAHSHRRKITVSFFYQNSIKVAIADTTLANVNEVLCPEAPCFFKEEKWNTDVLQPEVNR